MAGSGFAGAGPGAVVLVAASRRRPRPSPSSPPWTRTCGRARPSASRISSFSSSPSFGALLEPVADHARRTAGSCRRAPRPSAAAEAVGGRGREEDAPPRSRARALPGAAASMSSRIQNERPWVATTRSSSFTIRSVTGTTGRLSWSGCQRGARVERDVDARLGAGEEQARAHRVLAHDAHERVGRQARGDRAPASCRSRCVT